MIMNDQDRRQFLADVTTSTDLASATAELKIDSTLYACTWTGAATSGGGQWTRTARTDGWFAGPSVPPGDLDGATVLELGKHDAEVVVSVGGTIVATRTAPISVRA